MRTKYASTRFSIVKRSKGQSAVDAASYISRSVLVSGSCFGRVQAGGGKRKKDGEKCG